LAQLEPRPDLQITTLRRNVRSKWTNGSLTSRSVPRQITVPAGTPSRYFVSSVHSIRIRLYTCNLGSAVGHL